MLGLDIITTAGWLILAGNTVQCTVPKSPNIVINPVSAPIQYDFSQSTAELSKIKTDTVSPYAPGADTSTGGLRHDKPRVAAEVKWNTMHYPSEDVVCLWYEEVKVTIELNPKIYIARENSHPVCRDAIREHEERHVSVDRQVINQYAQAIGNSIKQAVDQAGVMGPYNFHELETVQKQLVDHVNTAVDSQKFLLYQEMSRRQAQVDTLEEYERISRICQEVQQ